MRSPSRKALTACYSALWRGLVNSAPHTKLDERGYVAEVTQNLIEGVSLNDFEADLHAGDGNELASKFRAAHSSAALAINTFARFRKNPAELRLPTRSGFTSLQFERKCPHGIIGRRSPNLDVLLEGRDCVLAIESKCTEHLSRHNAAFSPAYDAEIRDNRRETAWFEVMERLTREPEAFCWLDAAQLVKHAFGLAYTFPDRPTTLLYLFWEPSNPEAHPIFAEHRGEVARFAASIQGASPNFVSMSYSDLWTFWDAQLQCDWLPSHVGRLRARYSVAA